ncbi:MAG TPA: GTP cyclohydrolase IIa [Candidatus Nitrosopolaris sp.]|nr:GTP cyclohydrolase IIa [Candidatus Nitrosopolaris sp.]
MTIQLTIIRIEEYGPWTITLGSDREARLQMLQANFYFDLQRLFSAKDCLVYLNRFDEYFAITNGLSVADHEIIESELSSLYKKMKLSMAIGSGETPYQANLDAYNARRMGQIVTKKARIFASAALPSSIVNFIPTVNEFVQIMHIDMNNSTDIGSKLSPYEITCLIMKIYAMLSEEFVKKESLTFFLGGDNFMVVSNAVTKQDAEETITKVTQGTNIKLNCGIGIGRTGRKAAKAATKALDTIRNLRNVGKDLPVYEVGCL